MAMRLEDDDARIAALAQLFFHELAKKEYKVGCGPARATRMARAAKTARAERRDPKAEQAHDQGTGLPKRKAGFAACRCLPPCRPSLLPSHQCVAALPAGTAQGTSPIYNLLPDILSNLSKERGLGKAQFQSIMQHVSGAGHAAGGASGQAGQQGRRPCCVPSCRCAVLTLGSPLPARTLRSCWATSRRTSRATR